MTTRRLFLLGILLLLFAASNVSGVAACSGGAFFGIEDLSKMDLVVKAMVLDTDDRGHNAILRIEEYYKGSGGYLLTVMRYPTALVSGSQIRRYDTSCMYSGYGQRWIKGNQGYFGLRSNNNGTFTDLYGGSAQFYIDNGEIRYWPGSIDDSSLSPERFYTMTEDDFVERLLAFGERHTAVPPDLELPQFYPLMRFLNVTTEAGTRYQINPDRSLSQLPDDAPLAISPDGAQVAFREDEGTIAFQYIWTIYLYENYPWGGYEGPFDYFYPLETFTMQPMGQPFERLKRPGQAVRFSNDSNFAAVWDQTHLAVYMLRNDGWPVIAGFGGGIRLALVMQVELAKSVADRMPHVLWSADSSTIVWQDATGVWRWNLINDAQAQQVMTAAEIGVDFPALLDVSTHGRYVRVGQPNQWTLIDAETGDRFENVVAAPTEQFLIFIDLWNGEYTEAWRTEALRCTPPLRETCAVHLVTDTSDLQMIFPYRRNLLGIYECFPGRTICPVNGRSWHPAISDSGRFISRGYALQGELSTLRQIVYDPQYGQPAILVGDYAIHFDFYNDGSSTDLKDPGLDIVDLEGEVDSPIAFIEWGQPVFYDEYLLTTSEYMPR